MMLATPKKLALLVSSDHEECRAEREPAAKVWLQNPALPLRLSTMNRLKLTLSFFDL